MNYKVIKPVHPDDSNLAQCWKCGFIDNWDEIPRGKCQFTEDTMTECPECGDVDGFSDYDPSSKQENNK